MPADQDGQAPVSAQPKAELPSYVRDAMRGLTIAQKRTLVDGYYGGENMTLVRKLLDKHLFYIKPNSPNGRYGTLELTPLGVTISGVLKSRAALAQQVRP